jgi:signal transduction histidine kinase
VMPAEITAPALAAIEAALAGRDVNGFEYRLTVGGELHHFEARVSATASDAVVFLVRNVTERRRGEERARFLARAGTTLASSLDYGNTVETLARMAVPFLADICVVDLLEHSRFRCAAVAAATPEREALVYAVRAQHPLEFSADPLAPSPLLRAGPVLHARVGGEATPPDLEEENAAMLRAVRATAAITVPLVARGQLLGVMLLAAASPDRRYDERDLAVAEELAKRAAIALDNARLYREVQESSRLKDEFLGIVSHELRTPLNAVLGWSQVLRRGKIDDEQAARALDAIDRNARAQARLVDDLLDTSRVVSGKLRIDIAPTPVASVVANATDSFAPLARTRGVDLETRISPDVGCIPADSSRLQQVVGNLLANALKFTPPGGRVEVSVTPVGPYVEIRVTDTGIGIKPEFLPYVFERFRQADSTTTRTHGGLGIGLAIVRHLVQLHGGMIQVESDGENQGATFIVLLPASPAAAVSPAEGAQSA